MNWVGRVQFFDFLPSLNKQPFAARKNYAATDEFDGINFV